MDWMEEAVALLLQGGRLLLKAYPGAGKSTLFPLRLLKALPGRVLLFEPQRVAARAVAARLAENLGEPLGKTVGYRVRLEGRESRETRLLVMTEGLLLRLLLEDPTLEGVSAVLWTRLTSATWRGIWPWPCSSRCRRPSAPTSSWPSSPPPPTRT
jgi:HrpA-like helicases